MTDNSPTSPAEQHVSSEDGSFAAVAALAALQGITTNPDEVRLLGILTDPKNHEYGSFEGSTPMECYDALDENVGDYLDGDYESSWDGVAQVMASHYTKQKVADPTRPDLGWTFAAGLDGTIGGIEVSIDFGQWPNDLRLAKWYDLKHTTRSRDAKAGIASALSIAAFIESHYEALVTKAKQRGLLGVAEFDAGPVHTALASLDPQAEVVPAATVTVMRDALTRLLAAAGMAPEEV